MKRFELIALQGAGADTTDAIRPNLSGSYVVLASRAGYALVKRPEVDGAAVTATTICDLQDGAADVTATNLTAGQRTTIKNFLTARGFDTADFDGDGVNDRKKLLRFVLRRLLNAPELDGEVAIRGFDVA